MEALYIFLGMSTLLVFLFKREWLLQKKPFLVLLFINLVLFALGYLFQDISKLVVALKMPLLSQLLFWALVFVFRKIYNRDPVDTFWTMDISLMKDGIFNFIFWAVAVILPTVLVFGKII